MKKKKRKKERERKKLATDYQTNKSRKPADRQTDYSAIFEAIFPYTE